LFTKGIVSESQDELAARMNLRIVEISLDISSIYISEKS